MAAAAATLFIAGCATGGSRYATAGQVECAGVNGCKGLSECKTANNACKGKNSCRYEGFLYMDPFACHRAQNEARAGR